MVNGVEQKEVCVQWYQLVSRPEVPRNVVDGTKTLLEWYQQILKYW